MCGDDANPGVKKSRPRPKDEGQGIGEKEKVRVRGNKGGRQAETERQGGK
jgi:hypothetical protein